MIPPLELHLTASQRCSAIQLLQQHSDLTADNINSCFDNGAVWLQQSSKASRIRDSHSKLSPGQQLHLYCNASTLQPCPYQPTLIEDFESFSIWNKPSGMLSQGSKWGDHWALYRWIEQHTWPERSCFITHRLDRYTQGLMIVAHTEACNSKLHRMFEQREVKKTYRAVVKGLIDHTQAFEISQPLQNKKALTVVRVLARNEQLNYSLIEASPETGRKHQIRIHLAQIGHPVLNDRHYGTEPHQGDLQLQATALAFRHPDSQQLIQIELPQANRLSFSSSSVIK